MPGVFGQHGFHSGSNDRRLSDQQRHCLTLHVRTHKARFASSCSRNGIRPAETPTIWGCDVIYRTISGSSQLKVSFVSSNNAPPMLAPTIIPSFDVCPQGRRTAQSLRRLAAKQLRQSVCLLHDRDTGEPGIRSRQPAQRYPGWKSVRCSCLPEFQSDKFGRSEKCERHELQNRLASG